MDRRQPTAAAGGANADHDPVTTRGDDDAYLPHARAEPPAWYGAARSVPVALRPFPVSVHALRFGTTFPYGAVVAATRGPARWRPPVGYDHDYHDHDEEHARRRAAHHGGGRSPRTLGMRPGPYVERDDAGCAGPSDDAASWAVAARQARAPSSRAATGAPPAQERRPHSGGRHSSGRRAIVDSADVRAVQPTHDRAVGQTRVHDAWSPAFQAFAPGAIDADRRAADLESGQPRRPRHEATPPTLPTIREARGAGPSDSAPVRSGLHSLAMLSSSRAAAAAGAGGAVEAREEDAAAAGDTNGEHVANNDNTKTKAKKRVARNCTAPVCDKLVVDHSVCIRHGGGRRCNVEGCECRAQCKGLCWKHGGYTICEVDGCGKRAKSRGMCWSHGGGTQCKTDGCIKIAVSRGRCWAHGGGKRCKVPDCRKPAALRTDNFCSDHYATLQANQLAAA